MSKDRNNKKGFTLAEVLITLTIIGVVAALTIPSLLASVKDKTYESKRKGFATRMAQAISQMDVLNSYEAKIPTGYTGSETAIEYAQNFSSMNFITEGLSKVYRIANICEYEKYLACDFPPRFKTWQNSPYETRNYSAWNNLNASITAEKMGGIIPRGATFKTKNGESVLLWYNPKCVPEQSYTNEDEISFLNEICVTMWYDLDGSKKGPNQFGKDMGWLLVLYPDTPFLVSSQSITYLNTETRPSYSSSDTLGASAERYCSDALTAYGYNIGSWTLPSKEELFNIALNSPYYVSADNRNRWYWSNTIDGSSEDDYGWQVNLYQLTARRALRSAQGSISCIVK